MHSQRRRHQIDERRLVADFSVAEEFGACDVAATPVSFNALPIVDSLQNVFARFRYFQLDNNQSAVLPEGQQINGATPRNAASRGAKLSV